jgi:CBS domain-containing protein
MGVSDESHAESSQTDGESTEPRVANLMRTGLPTLAPDDSVGRVAQLLVDHGVPGLPVVEAGEIIGLVSEGDLVSQHADFTPPGVVSVLDAVFVTDAGWDYDDEIRRALAMTARDLMSHPVYSIRARASLADVATLIHQRRVNPVPVVDDDGNLVGLVSSADLVRVIARLERDPPAPDSAST